MWSGHLLSCVGDNSSCTTFPSCLKGREPLTKCQNNLVIWIVKFYMWMIDCWPLYCMGAFQSPTPNRSGPTMVRSPKSRLKAWTLASIAQTIQNKFRKKHHDTDATVTICNHHSLSAWKLYWLFYAFLSRRCVTELFAHLRSHPIPYSALGFECPVALSQEAPTVLMQTGKKGAKTDKPW